MTSKALQDAKAQVGEWTVEARRLEHEDQAARAKAAINELRTLVAANGAGTVPADPGASTAGPQHEQISSTSAAATQDSETESVAMRKAMLPSTIADQLRARNPRDAVEASYWVVANALGLAAQEDTAQHADKSRPTQAEVQHKLRAKLTQHDVQALGQVPFNARGTAMDTAHMGLSKDAALLASPLGQFVGQEMLAAHAHQAGGAVSPSSAGHNVDAASAAGLGSERAQQPLVVDTHPAQTPTFETPKRRRRHRSSRSGRSRRSKSSRSSPSLVPHRRGRRRQRSGERITSGASSRTVGHVTAGNSAPRSPSAQLRQPSSSAVSVGSFAAAVWQPTLNTAAEGAPLVGSVASHGGDLGTSTGDGSGGRSGNGDGAAYDASASWAYTVDVPAEHRTMEQPTESWASYGTAVTYDDTASVGGAAYATGHGYHNAASTDWDAKGEAAAPYPYTSGVYAGLGWDDGSGSHHQVQYDAAYGDQAYGSNHDAAPYSEQAGRW